MQLANYLYGNTVVIMQRTIRRGLICLGLPMSCPCPSSLDLGIIKPAECDNNKAHVQAFKRSDIEGYVIYPPLFS
jgi:hypothetical protein